MKKILSIIAITSILVSCGNKTEEVTTEETPAREVKIYNYNDFGSNPQMGPSGYNYNEEKMIFCSDITGIMNLYSIPVTGGEPTQLTFSELESNYFQGSFPNDDRLLYRHDQGGDENDHLYILETDGTSKDITPYEGSKSYAFGFNHAGTHFYYGSNNRALATFDMYRLKVDQLSGDQLEPELMYQNDSLYTSVVLSDNDSLVAAIKNAGNDKSNMYVLNRITGEILYSIEAEGTVTHNNPSFSLDCETLYYTTNDGSDFTYLAALNLETGKRTSKFESDWNVSGFSLSKNDKYITIGYNEDAKFITKVYELASGVEVDLPSFDGMWPKTAVISRSEENVRLLMGSSTCPSPIYHYKLGEKPVYLAGGFASEIDEQDMVIGKVIRFKSFDGEEIPANFYLPHGASETNQVPCVLFIHGGPGGQSMLGYRANTQFLVNNGYAVLAVNNRGSSGYGTRFGSLDDKKHGEDDLQDCVWSKKYLESTGVIDMDKVGIAGGSYGGCMTMAALCFTPEEFDVGINIFGVTNWIRTLKSIPPHWASFRQGLYEELGDPYTDDSVRLKKISPLFHTEHVTKPLLVIQGMNDVRVLPIESEEIVEAVKANGVPVEYITFADEGHGFRKKENQKKMAEAMLVFLDKYLKKIPEELPQ